MSRSEFSKAIRGQRYVLAKGHCEVCGIDLAGKKAEYDHHIADGAGGKPTLANCRLLCGPCHRIKTSNHDVPLVAKIKRQSAVAAGVKIENRRPITSAPFPPSGRRRAHPMVALAPKSLFEPRGMS